MTFDVVVAGGGAAGCVLAARLSEDPARSVCLLEGGRDYGAYRDGGWPADLLDGRQLALDHVWPPIDEDRSKLRPRVLGGGSSVNACWLGLGPPQDYDWGHGWTHDTLTPYAERALETMGSRRLGDDELGRWHRHVLEAARAAGHDAAPNLANLRGTTRWNAAFAYLDPARNRSNLTDRSDVVVERLDPPRVLLADRSTVAGRLIVLACGAYETPALLLRSGLGDGLPVGEGLTDHPGVGLGFADDPAATETQMSQVTVRVRSTFARDEDWDAFFFSAEEGPKRSIVVFSMTPASRGAVRLENGALVVDHGFLAGEDAERIVEVIRTVRELLGPDERPGPEPDLDTYVRENVRGFFHPVGTCALDRVVDPGGRLLGVDGVAIGDASVIPNVPRVPTHLTVLAVAERLAESLGE